MDFQALTETHRDTLWEKSLDTICEGLHNIFPEKTTAEFRSHLQEGYEKKKRHWPIWPLRIDFNTYTEVRRLPVFDIDRDKEKSGKSGFHAEVFNARKRTYGSLASRTIGTMYGAVDSARFGLEMAYDSILRGLPGIAHKRKILNKKLTIVDTQPIDGSDIVSTIDVDIQDLAERSVLDELRLPEVNGDVGVAIVMEVATGDVKAIVNMERCPDGEYREVRNHAVSDMLEPIGLQDRLHHGSPRRRCGRHHLPRRHRRRCMAHVRSRDARPQLAARRIRRDEPAPHAGGEFEYRREPHHRPLLPRPPREIC